MPSFLQVEVAADTSLCDARRIETVRKEIHSEVNIARRERVRRVEKPWGYELIFAHTDKYAGKILSIGKGCRLSLQYHEYKDESIYVHRGEVLVQLEAIDGQRVSTVLRNGECLRIEPFTQHRIQAVRDAILFEVSTPDLEDVRRVEDDYGRAR